MTTLFVRAFTALLCATVVGACVSTQSEDPDELVGESTEAYSGTLATLVATTAPRGAPGPWAQPDSEGLVGQYGYCGATAAANLLAWYNLHVSHARRSTAAAGASSAPPPRGSARTWAPRTPSSVAREERCRGTRTPSVLFAVRSPPGRPVIVQFMTGALDAHWVTVVGIRGAGNSPDLVVMSWGKLHDREVVRLPGRVAKSVGRLLPARDVQRRVPTRGRDPHALSEAQAFRFSPISASSTSVAFSLTM